MNSRKFCRQRFGAAGLAALLLAIVLLFCQAHPAVQIEPAAAAGPRSVAVCGTPFGVKMFSDGALVAVSYTHLDVYKRQATSTAPPPAVPAALARLTPLPAATAYSARAAMSWP